MEPTPKISQSSAEKVIRLYARPDVRAAVEKINDDYHVLSIEVKQVMRMLFFVPKMTAWIWVILSITI